MDAIIFDAVRTPRGRGRPDGALHQIKPVALLAGLLRDLKMRQKLDTAQVDDIVIGCATPVGEQGSCIAKTAAMAAGWDWMASGMQLSRFSASGLDAVNMAAQKVRSGWEDLVVAGGVESMSRVPPGADRGAWILDPETKLNADFIPPGIAADLIATLEGFTRDDVDAYALASQQRASNAHAKGRFRRTLVPMIDYVGEPILAHDEIVKPDTTLEGLAKLKVRFQRAGAMGFDAIALRRYPQIRKINHVHTAGNSSSAADGAAALLIGSEAKGRLLGLTPRARIVASASAGSDPTLMLTGLVGATRKALSKADLNAGQIDLFEVNEGFAAPVLLYIKKMEVPHDRVNVNGGSIALGHPVGASGAMILATLLDELEMRQLRYGLATISGGPGMAIATIIERI